ncbi:MAG: alkaline phosphatase family protein, partial [Actinomycetota bacterium]
GDDVLGYYDGYQLPMYDYLAKHYAYCDRFFASHPGPTLPNRMYALTGDVQYDFQNIPILENNSGDNVQLSRAQTIFDVLDRRGVTWKIYESDPSVAMLRMFARYAGDNTRIVPMDEFERDLDLHGLPQFCVIEPQMHAEPQDDDHPDADMWRGQQFIFRVYTALRNLASWNDTLLIITYDEHGGFYDHVIPPIAEILDAGVGGANLPGGGPFATNDPIGGDDDVDEGEGLGPGEEPAMCQRHTRTTRSHRRTDASTSRTGCASRRFWCRRGCRPVSGRARCTTSARS